MERISRHREGQASCADGGPSASKPQLIRQVSPTTSSEVASGEPSTRSRSRTPLAPSDSKAAPMRRKTGIRKAASKSTSPSSSNSSERHSEGEEWVKPARPKAKAKVGTGAGESRSTADAGRGKRKASARHAECVASSAQDRPAAGSVKCANGIKLPLKIPKPPAPFTNLNLPVKLNPDTEQTSQQRRTNLPEDHIMESRSACVGGASLSREPSFGPGYRALSKDSMFSENNAEASRLSSQSQSPFSSQYSPQDGPWTPTKKARTGIVLPSKETKGEAEPSSSQEVMLGIEDLAASQSHLEFLIAASQLGPKTSPHHKRMKEVKMPTDVKSLKVCPFCDTVMPRRISTESCEMMQPWLDRYHAGKPMKKTDTAAVCEKHRAESNIIPVGVKQGWPKDLDLSKLLQRLEGNGPTRRNYRDGMKNVLQSPASSPFMVSALERRASRAKNTDRSTAEILDVQAGYYGEIGYELFRKTLIQWFHFQPSDLAQSIQSPAVLEALKPLTAVEFVGDVMVPHLACLLIMEDYARRKGLNKRELTFEEARTIKLESAPYGIALFSAEAADAGDDLYAKAKEPSNQYPAAEIACPVTTSRPRPSQTSLGMTLSPTSPRRGTGKKPSPPADRKPKAKSLRTDLPSASAPATHNTTDGSSFSQDRSRAFKARPAMALSQPVLPSARGVAVKICSRSPVQRRATPEGPARKEKDDDVGDGDDDDDDDEFFLRSRPRTLQMNSSQRTKEQVQASQDDDCEVVEVTK